MGLDGVDGASVDRIARESEWRNMALNRIANNLRGSLVNKGLLLAMSLVALDSLLVAHYQPDVALALIRWTPPLSLLEGVLVNLLPVGVPVIVAVMVTRAAMHLSGVASGETYAGAGLTSLLTALAAWFLGWFLVPSGILASGALVVSILLSLAGVALAESDYSEPRGISGRTLCGIAMVMSLIGLCVTVVQSWGDKGQVMQQRLAQPWVPAEVIQWKGAQAPTVGYVLSLSDGWAAVLDENSRRMVLRPASDLTGRAVCAMGDTALPSMRVVPHEDSLRCPR